MKTAIRVDASERIGSGHVMRCLALAEVLRQHKVEVSFISRAWTGHVLDRVLSQGFDVRALPANDLLIDFSIEETKWAENFDWKTDASETAAEFSHPDWLIVDHYAVGAEWLQAVRPHVKRVLVLDDLDNRALPADLLLDPGLAPRRAASPGTKCLLGPSYALLRPEFAQAHRNSAVRERGLQQVFLFLTGGDDRGATFALAQALEPIEGIAVHAVLTPLTQQWPRIAEIFTRRRWTLSRPGGDVIKWLQNADVAVGAAGVSLWERCCLGLPSAVLTLARNQERQVPYAEQAGLVYSLGRAGEVSVADLTTKLRDFLGDSGRLIAMSKKGLETVDGNGCERVFQAMCAVAQSGSKPT